MWAARFPVQLNIGKLVEAVEDGAGTREVTNMSREANESDLI